MGYFQTLNQRALAERIERARSCVIYAVPGVTFVVADALALSARDIGPENVVVVMDASANVSRMGYGQFETFKTLTDAGIQPRYQPGLRQSLLIVDNAGWAFTMRPAMLEDEALADEPAPNAIELTSAQVLALRAELPQPAVIEATAASIDPDDRAGLTVRVGANLMSREQFEETKADLEIAPPQEFDLQRQVNIYTSFIRFAELKMEGWRVEQRKIQLPSSLPVLATRDKELNKRIRSTLRILENIGDGALKGLREEIDELRKHYCQSVGSLGRVILRSNQSGLEESIADIEKRFEATKERLRGDIEANLGDAIDASAPEFAEPVLDNPPSQHGLNQQGAEAFVRAELKKVFPTAGRIMERMRLTLVFKGVTYEMLKNKNFKDRVLLLFDESALPSGLLNEYRGAQERRAAKANAENMPGGASGGGKKGMS